MNDKYKNYIYYTLGIIAGLVLTFLASKVYTTNNVRFNVNLLNLIRVLTPFVLFGAFVLIYKLMQMSKVGNTKLDFLKTNAIDPLAEHIFEKKLTDQDLSEKSSAENDILVSWLPQNQRGKAVALIEILILIAFLVGMFIVYRIYFSWMV
jgi:hypothetical protein